MPLSTEAVAVVDGTGDSGLRLNGRPGADRLGVLPEDSVVTVLCRVTGPEIVDGNGPTSTWSQVRTGDGRTGYMSEAFLAFDTDPAGVPGC